MLSGRLQNFVGAWCDMDSDIEEVARLLRKYPNDGWALWLQGDLRAAIEGQDFTPQLAEGLTGLAFDVQGDVDDWLRDLWTTWFPSDPYPGE